MVAWKLYRIIVKNILSNYYFWLFSIFFVVFWSFMGAYAFSRNITIENTRRALINAGTPPEVVDMVLDEVWSRVVRGYTGGWYATVIVVSFGSTATGLIEVVYYSTIPLRYLSKFSRISSRRILLELIVGSLVILLVSFVMLLAVTTLMFSHRFSQLVLPENPAGLLAAGLAYGLFIYVFSMALGLLVVVLRKPGLLSKITFIPLVLAIAFSMISVYIGGEVYHYSPFISSMNLIFYYYTAVKPPLDQPLAFATADYTPVEPLHAWITQISWTVAFILISLLLLEKQKGVPAEEIIKL
ncbi:MAG: hypothetical protein QW579_06275 [Desulfurococcaceae archaeon]